MTSDAVSGSILSSDTACVNAFLLPSTNFKPFPIYASRDGTPARRFSIPCEACRILNNELLGAQAQTELRAAQLERRLERLEQIVLVRSEGEPERKREVDNNIW